jgi:hypothetical protein
MQAWEHADYTQSQMLDTLLTRFQDLTATVTALTRSVEAIHTEDALQRAARLASGGGLDSVRRPRTIASLSDLLKTFFHA